MAVAMDATGLETTAASAHFVSGAGRARRRWVKISMAVVCGSLLPPGLVAEWGPGNDKFQAAEFLDKSLSVPLDCLPQRLLADAGYDAHWIHELCRGQWGVQTLIKAVRHRADGTLGGEHCSAMTPQHLKKRGCGKRWHVESFFSGLKRVTGSALRARSDAGLLTEASIRVLAYSLHR